MRIAILGCGPSGLVAAHAAMYHMEGEADEVEIFSNPVKSPIYGAQYLHQPIPGTPSMVMDPRVIRYVMQGDPEQYLKKVYGAEWDGTINDDMRDQAHLAWDIRGTYDYLWQIWQDRITPMEMTLSNVGAVVEGISAEYDMVINTIPRPALCQWPSRHRFVSTKIWALGETPGKEFPYPTSDEVIFYNGLTDQSWYRIARMYGYTTVEWPGWHSPPPFSGAALVKKPLSHNCDCWPGVVHLGRMGRWQNGRLVHHVFADTIEQIMLKGME